VFAESDHCFDAWIAVAWRRDKQHETGEVAPRSSPARIASSFVLGCPWVAVANFLGLCRSRLADYDGSRLLKSWRHRRSNCKHLIFCSCRSLSSSPLDAPVPHVFGHAEHVMCSPLRSAHADPVLM